MNAVQQAKGRVRSVPLRVKLVTSVLALVAVALLVISSLTAYFLRNYLEGQVDGQIRSTAQGLGQLLPKLRSGEINAMLPSDYVVIVADEQRVYAPTYDDRSLDLDQLPAFPTSRAGFEAEEGEPKTVVSHDGYTRWRVYYAPSVTAPCSPWGSR